MSVTEEIGSILFNQPALLARVKILPWCRFSSIRLWLALKKDGIFDWYSVPVISLRRAFGRNAGLVMWIPPRMYLRYKSNQICILLPLTSSLLQCGGFLFVPQSWYWPKCRCLACLYGWIWIENRETYWACLWSEVVLQQENLSGRRLPGCPLASRGRQRQHCQQVDSGQGCTLQSDSSPQMSNRVRNYVF